MKRLLLTLLCAAALFGQEPVSRVVPIKHFQPDFAAPVLDILSSGKVKWRTDNQLKNIALHGPAELVDAMEAAIKKMDVPTRNIELTFHMLLASPQGDSGAIPPHLAGVVQQLRTVFGSKAIRVVGDGCHPRAGGEACQHEWQHGSCSEGGTKRELFHRGEEPSRIWRGKGREYSTGRAPF